MRILGTMTVVWLLAAILAVRFAPFGSDQPEWLWAGMGLPAIFVFGCFAVWCAASFRGEHGFKSNINFVQFGVPMLVCIAIWSGLSSSREAYVAKLQLDVTGFVVEKYESRNHAAASIRIETESKDFVELDDVTHQVWDITAVGDAVRKLPWSEYGNINGQKLKLIERW